MAGTFDKCLHAMIPRTRHQLTHSVELGKLGGIIGIVGRTGTEAVTQGNSHVVAMADLANIVEMGIEETLLVVGLTPLGDDATAAAHHTREATDRQRYVLQADATMDGEVVHTLLTLLDERVAEHLPVEILRLATYFLKRLVHGDGTHGHRTVAENPFARLVDIVACGQIHQRVTSPLAAPHGLVNFFLNARRHGGVANIGVDLNQEVRTDDHRLGLGMVDIGWNDGTALGDLLADKLGGDKRLDTTLLAVHVFADGDILHLLRDDAFAGAVHDRLSLSALCPRLAEFRKTFAQVDFHLWVAIRTAGVVDRHGRILDILLLAIDHLDSRRECHLAHTDAQLWEEHALAIDLPGGRIGEMRIELFGFHLYCCFDCSNIRRMAFVSSTGCSASRMPPLIATPLTPVCSTGSRSARVIPPMATTGSRMFSRLMASTMAR